jgi:hypothetical protein
MTEQTPITEQTPQAIKTEAEWRRFMRKHWAAFTIFAAAAVLLAAGAVYVFVWFVGNAQSTGLVPSTLNLWTMNNLVMFILHAIFWELVLIGIPAAVGGIAGWAWWKRIPEQEKQEYNLSQKKSKSNRAGGAISPLLFIAFAIKVYVDGNWNTTMASWTVDYVVGSMVTILIWVVAVFAIPAIVGLVWWLCRGTNKKP